MERAVGIQNDDEDEVHAYDAQLCPLLYQGCTEPQKVWKELKAKEAKYQHSVAMFDQHPDLDPQKRAILFSWLSEVCELFELHRETYYLSVELVDRFLLCSADVPTCHLQLTGITALMVAAKMEENRPPKGKDFAFMTDGACDWKEVRDFEMFLSQKLCWRFSPPTPNTWLQLYLQVAATQHRLDPGTAGHSMSPSHPHVQDTNMSNASPSSWDVSVLVEHTRTMDLAKAKETQHCDFPSSRGKMAGETMGGVTEMTVCKGIRDRNFEGAGESESKEDETGEENDDGKMHVEVDRICEKETICLCRKTADPVCACRLGRMCGKVYKGNEAVDINTQGENKENTHEGFVETNVDRHEKTEDKAQAWWTARDGLSYSRGKENINGVSFEAQVDGVDLEDREMTCCEEEAQESRNVLHPRYCPQDYVKSSQLMDLVVLDSNSLRFKYSVLAAAVLFHCVQCEDICHITGLTWNEISPCIDWMRIHKMVLETSPQAAFWGSSVQPCDLENGHMIQSHFVSECMWKTAMSLSDRYFTSEHERTAVIECVQLQHALSMGPHSP